MHDSDESTRNPGDQLTPEDYLQEITIGEHRPRNSTITLDPYNQNWPAQYSRLEARVRQALGDKVLLIEHVGSTAVEGLSAKPIIDMVLVVSDSADEGSYLPPLEENGFIVRIREPEWHKHRMLKAQDIPANLHIFSEGCGEVTRMLSFRDWLRTHPADKALYERTKHGLAGRIWKYTQHYADAKSEVVEAILRRAADESNA